MQIDLHAENARKSSFQSAIAFAFPSWSRRSTTTLYSAEKQILLSCTTPKRQQQCGYAPPAVDCLIGDFQHKEAILCLCQCQR